MGSKYSSEQLQAIKEILDKAIQEGPWDQSAFLRVIGKNLQDMQDTFLATSNHKDPKLRASEGDLAHRVALRKGQKEIFISLYTSDGSEMNAWERILANLPKHVVSRPIYSDESEVQKLVRAKDNPVNEAYVAVFIDKADILDLPDERTSRDRYGIKLLSLKDKSIHPDNISRLVHRTGTYLYRRGRLLAQISSLDKDVDVSGQEE